MEFVEVDVHKHCRFHNFNVDQRFCLFLSQMGGLVSETVDQAVDMVPDLFSAIIALLKPVNTSPVWWFIEIMVHRRFLTE